jgi:hypothetical protein
MLAASAPAISGSVFQVDSTLHTNTQNKSLEPTSQSFSTAPAGSCTACSGKAVSSGAPSCGCTCPYTNAVAAGCALTDSFDSTTCQCVPGVCTNTCGANQVRGPYNNANPSLSCQCACPASANAVTAGCTSAQYFDTGSCSCQTGTCPAAGCTGNQVANAYPTCGCSCSLTAASCTGSTPVFNAAACTCTPCTAVSTTYSYQ